MFEIKEILFVLFSFRVASILALMNFIRSFSNGILHLELNPIDRTYLSVILLNASKAAVAFHYLL